jgi:hypothetical protein
VSIDFSVPLRRIVGALAEPREVDHHSRLIVPTEVRKDSAAKDPKEPLDAPGRHNGQRTTGNSQKPKPTYWLRTRKKTGRESLRECHVPNGNSKSAKRLTSSGSINVPQNPGGVS